MTRGELGLLINNLHVVSFFCPQIDTGFLLRKEIHGVIEVERVRGKEGVLSWRDHGTCKGRFPPSIIF